MPEVKVHIFDTTDDAYDACQTDETIRDGDVLVIPGERVVGIACTWPFACTTERGALHKADRPMLKKFNAAAATVADEIKKLEKMK